MCIDESCSCGGDLLVHPLFLPAFEGLWFVLVQVRAHRKIGVELAPPKCRVSAPRFRVSTTLTLNFRLSPPLTLIFRVTA